MGWSRSRELWIQDHGRTMEPLRRLSRRAFKPIYILYYKLLFGRRFPFSERLAARVHAWELATGRGDAPAAKDVWEEQYRGGKWELMRGLDELARYSLIAGYLPHLHPRGPALDLGSGEGAVRRGRRWLRRRDLPLPPGGRNRAAPRGDLYAARRDGDHESQGNLGGADLHAATGACQRRDASKRPSACSSWIRFRRMKRGPW